MSVLRALTVVRAAYGATLLLAPATVLSRLAGDELDPPARRVARVLGARELAQAELTRRHPGHGVQLTGAAVDAAHAASMVGLAAADRRHRRLALHNAITASGLSLASLIAARLS